MSKRLFVNKPNEGHLLFWLLLIGLLCLQQHQQVDADSPIKGRGKRARLTSNNDEHSKCGKALFYFGKSAVGGAFCATDEVQDKGYFWEESEAIPEQFPSYVTVEFGVKEMCHGALIERDLVLTSAHCLSQATTGGLVRAGTKGKYSKLHAIFHGQVRNWNSYCKIKTQPKPTKKWSDGPSNDLALVKLEKPFDLDVSIQTACLVTDKFHRKEALCFAAGKDEDNTLLTFPMKRGCIKGDRGRAHNATCYTSKLRQRVNAPQSFFIGGSPMYCIDKCSGTPKVVLVGIGSYTDGPDILWGAKQKLAKLDKRYYGIIPQRSNYGYFADVYKLREIIKTELTRECFKKDAIHLSDDESDE